MEPQFPLGGRPGSELAFGRGPLQVGPYSACAVPAQRAYSLSLVANTAWFSALQRAPNSLKAFGRESDSPGSPSSPICRGAQIAKLQNGFAVQFLLCLTILRPFFSPSHHPT